MEEEIKIRERRNALLKAIVSGIKKSFVPEHGKLDDDDLVYIIKNYAMMIPVGKMLEAFERVKLKRFESI